MSEEKNQIKLPDGSFSPVIRGEQQEVLESVLKCDVSYFGPSVHFMRADAYDSGQVIKREYIIFM